MASMAFDTLRYSKRLRAVGFTEEQAEAQAEALGEAIRDTLVTKADLNEAVHKLQLEITELRSEFRTEIRDVQTNILKWIIPLMIGQTAVIAALVRLL